MLNTNPFTDDLFADATTPPTPADVSDLLDADGPARPASLTPANSPQDGPTLLTGHTPPPAPHHIPHSDHRPDDGPTLLADMDATAPAPHPALLQLHDTGDHLLYPGKINLLFASPGAGKSHLAMHLLDQQAQAGRTSLFLDYEKTSTDFTQRATEHAIPAHLHRHLAYWRPNRPLIEIQHTVLQYALAHNVTTVVIDGVGLALMHAGIDESHNSDVAYWFTTSISPLADAGLTILLIDHSGHAHPIPGRTPHPVGASAKLRYTTGALLHLAPGKPFSRDAPGHALLTCLKDNVGHLPAGQVLAEFHVTPHADGTTFRLTAPATAEDLTELVLAYVLQHTAEHGRGPSKNQVRQAVRHSESTRDAAIKKLVADGKIAIKPDGNALRLTPTSTPPSGGRV